MSYPLKPIKAWLILQVSSCEGLLSKLQEESRTDTEETPTFIPAQPPSMTPRKTPSFTGDPELPEPSRGP